MTKRKAKAQSTERVHKSGAFTGYDQQGEAYYPAPTYVEQFMVINDRRVAAEGLLAATNHYVTGELTRIAAESRKLWARLSEDYGVNFAPGSGWQFGYADQAIVKPPKEEPK